MLLNNGAPAQDAARVADAVGNLSGLLSIAQSESEDQSERCLGHLRSSRLPSASGQHQENVSRWIKKVVIAILSGAGTSARDKLLTYGMRIIVYDQSPDPVNPAKTVHSSKWAKAPDFDGSAARVYLALAGGTHQGLCDIYESAGAFKGGGWLQALATVPGAVKESGLRVRFEGKGGEQAVLVPLTEVIDLHEARIEALGDKAAQRAKDEALAERVRDAKTPLGPKERAQLAEYEAQIAAQSGDDSGGYDDGFG